jgi:hypothetical protein
MAPGNIKAEFTARNTSFGSSAIFVKIKPRRFPPPPHEGVGFIGILIYGSNSYLYDHYNKAGPCLTLSFYN